MTLPTLAPVDDATSTPRRRDRREDDAPLPRGELAKLRRWLSHAAETQIPPATPDVFQQLDIAPPTRRQAPRVGGRAEALVRRIGPCRLGPVESARLHDVSEHGLAVVVAGPVEVGGRLHVEVAPPPGLPRRLFRRGDSAVRLLVIVRHCRRCDDGFVVGCGAGVDLADGLADAMLPADLIWRATA